MKMRPYHILLLLLMSSAVGSALDIRENLQNAVLAMDKAELERVLNGQDEETTMNVLDSVKGGESLFSLAIQMEDISMVQLLVKLGANPHKESFLRILGKGATEKPLVYAQRWKSHHQCNSSIDAIIGYLAQETCTRHVDGRNVSEADTNGCSLCLHNDECHVDEACVNNLCVNPCSTACIEGANCTTINHITTCKCNWDMEGNPNACQGDSGCYECVDDATCLDDMFCKEYHCEDPCEYCTSTWGRCNVTNHKPQCSCPNGYKLIGQNGCQYIYPSIELYVSLSISVLLLPLLLGFCIMYFILRQRFLALQKKLKHENEGLYDQVNYQDEANNTYKDHKGCVKHSQHTNETMYLEPI